MTKFPFIIIVLLVLISCGDKNLTFPIGSDYVDVNTNIRYFDTLTVQSYTVLLDSITTSQLETPALLAGKYNDPAIGDINAQGYFRVALPASRSLPKNAVFDSLQLYLLYNKYYAGDTTQVFSLHAHRLNKTLKPNGNGKFYNTSTIGYEPAVFGSAILNHPKPNSGDTLWVDLDEAFGNELFNLLMEKDDRVSDNESFLNYFKGFMLSGDDADQAIIGFQFPSLSTASLHEKDPAMRLYYHYFDFENKTGHLDFLVQIQDYYMQFNNMSLSNRNPDLDLLTDQRIKLPASATDNTTYLLAGVGLVTRLEIPYLKNLFEINENIHIMDAELELKPVRNTYNTFALPQKTSLYQSDNLNNFSQGITTKNGYPQTGRLEIDEPYQVNTRYTFDITNFLDKKLYEESGETPSILLTVSPDNLYKTFDRLIVGSQQNQENEMKIRVYYMFYE
jgi:hypothetical protein